MGSKNTSPIGGYYPTASTTSSNTQSSGVSAQVPDPLAALAYYQTLQNAAQIANTPYQPYQGQMVAGFTPDQMAAFEGARQMQGIQTPYVAQSGNLYQQATAPGSWANPALPQVQDYYNQSFGYIPNQYMPQVAGYTAGALASTNNPMMGKAQDYFNQAFTSAVNPMLPTAQGYYGDTFSLSDPSRFGQSTLNQYMNPYQQSVVDATLNQMKQNQDVMFNQNTANAIRQGAYGGSGQFLGSAEIARQQGLANAQTLAQLNASNYQQAVQQYNQQQAQAIAAKQAAAQVLGQLGGQQAGLLSGAYQQAAQTLGQLGQQQAALKGQLGMQAADLFGNLGNALSQRGIGAYQNAAQNLGQLGQQQQELALRGILGAAQGVSGLGTQAQQAALADINALNTLGQQQQQLQQQQLSNAYQQWQQAQAYPYQQTSYFANLAQGLGPLLGQYGLTSGTQSGTSAQQGWQPYQNQSGGGGLGGLITAGLGLGTKLLSGGLFADGGSVTERTARATGGYMEDVGDKPYGEGPIDINAGFGPLLSKTPYSDGESYIERAEKTSRVMKPAKQVAAEKVQSQLEKLLNLDAKLPKASEPETDIKSKFFGAQDSGSGTDYGKLVNAGADFLTSASKKYGSGTDFGGLGSALGEFANAFESGGRVERADGGSFAEQYQRSKEAQDQAQNILAQYQNTLGRNAEQGGFDYWTQQAAKGMSPEAIASAFANSPERARQVQAAYVDVLKRAPDPEGYDYWLNKAKQGLSFGDLQKSIQGSPESMYRNILNRDGEPAGAAYWNKQAAAGMNPLTMQFLFQNSPEALGASAPDTLSTKIDKGWAALDPSYGRNKALAREKMIDPFSKPSSNYDLLLQQAAARNPGPQLTPEQQGMPSMPSADYYSPSTPRYAGTAGGNLNLAQSMNMGASSKDTVDRDTKFISSVYRNYMGRDPRSDEISTWMDALQKGTPASAVESAVRGSNEGQNTSYLQNLYRSALGRSADLGGLEYWKKQLEEGMPASEVASSIKSSQEYQSTPAMFRSNAPVQGYYTSIASNQVNPATGLFNLKYTAPYRSSLPTYDLSSVSPISSKFTDAVSGKLGVKKGGRVNKAAGGGLSGKSLYDYLISIGANPKEAAMLTGNAKVESSFNPYVMHDNNTGYGLWGHGKDRWYDMQKFTGQRKPGWEEQAKFALWELRNSPKTAMARQALAKADDAQGVAIAGMHYERPQGYRPSTPWAGKNWAQRYSNVASLMGGKDIGAGSALARINPNDPSGPLMDTAGPTRVAEAPRRMGLIPRILKALAPIGTAEAAEAQPLAKAEEKPMFALPTLRNPRMNNLPDALGWNQQQATLPEWKKEVQTGFGPLQGEKPADEAQLLAEPSRHTAMGPEMPEEKVVAADREEGKKSGKKYWGDWRDAEPWASDPIGGFFDTLSGEEKRADKPGKYEPQQGFDIGSLLGFADGGTVRHSYANGGGEDDLGNPLEELGSMIESGFGGLFGEDEKPTRAPEGGGLGDILGGLFGGGERPTPAGVVASDETPRRGLVSPAVSDALIAAGLGMMASPARDPWRAIGEGGLKGFQVYSELSEQERKRAEAEAQKRAAEAAAERYQRAISGEPPVAEDTETAAPRVTPPLGGAASTTTEAPPSAGEATAAPKTETTAEIDVEADPELRRLNSQLNRVASIPAPKGMESVKSSQLSNLRFQIEQRRSELESKVKAAEKAKAAELNTPEAKARAKQLEVEQEALAKEAVGVEQEAKQADQRIATLSRMRDAVSSGKFRTGALAEKELALKKAVQSVFPSAVDEEAIAMAEQFDKDALRAVTDATGGKLGAGVSDADVRFLTRQQAGLGTTKAGNVRTLEAAIKIEQRKKDIAQFARDYKKAHNGVLDSGYYQELQQWAEAHPMFVEEKGVKAEDTRGAPGKTVARVGKSKSTGKKVIEYTDGTREYAE